MGILVDDPDLGAGCLGGVHKRRAGVVEFAHQPWQIAALRPQPLRVVIEMRQVYQRQLRSFALHDFGSTAGNPT
jgi:hypothetical protein